MSIIFGIRGLSLTARERELLRSPSAVGVILFSRNYQDRQQLRALCESIYTENERLSISVDWEGGRVQRFRAGFTAIPAMGRLGELFALHRQRGLELARACGLIIGSELADLDFSYTPVLDLRHDGSPVIGDRAFSADPEAVFLLSQALRQGLREAGCAAVGKHFPGHGSIDTDSHLSHCEDRRPAAERARDEEPFWRSAADGIEALMTAHIVTPDSGGQPASFAPALLAQLRRRFAGALISDDLDMVGAATGSDYGAKVREALAAGLDCCLICNNFAAIERALGETYPTAAGRRERLMHLKRRHPPDPHLYKEAREIFNLWQENHGQ